MKRVLRWYVQKWRECFDDRDLLVQFFSRASLMCFHAAFGTALVLSIAWAYHFWRLYVV